MKITRLLAVALPVFAMSVSAQYALGGGYAPFSPNDAVRLRNFSFYEPIAVSPDGRLVARSVFRGSGAPRCDCTLFLPNGSPLLSAGEDVWIADVASGKSWNLTPSSGNNWGPVWSPDDRSLAFYSDRDGAPRVYVWDRSSGRTRRISSAILRVENDNEMVRWLPDSKHIVTLLKPTGTEQRSPPNLSPVSVDTGALADLAELDVRTGAVTRIARSVHAKEYRVSPDGRYLAYPNERGFTRTVYAGSVVNDLDIYDFTTGQHRTLIRQIVSDSQRLGFGMAWSPDSTRVAYIADGRIDSLKPGERGSCFVAQIGSGRVINATPGKHPAFDEYTGFPLWNAASTVVFLNTSTLPIGDKMLTAENQLVWRAMADGSSLTQLARIQDRLVFAIAPKGENQVATLRDGSILVATQDNATRLGGFWSVNPRTGSMRRIFEKPIVFGLNDSVQLSMMQSTDRRTIVYTEQSTNRAADLWATKNNFATTRQITNINPVLAKRSIGSALGFTFTSLDGRRLNGGLLFPPNYVHGKRYPLIIWLYSGTFLPRQIYQFGVERDDAEGATLNYQVLASHGYMMLVADVPTKIGTPMRSFYDSVMPAVDWAIKSGYADPNRLGVIGQSFGGYGTLSTIVQTTRFKAAVDYAGVSDLVSFDPGWAAASTQGGLGGTLWQVRDRYIANSPVFFFDRVKTPLLIVQGDADSLLSQSEEAYGDMNVLNKPVKYLKYAGEGHVLSQSKNILDFWKNVFAFFDAHLK